MRTDRSRDDRLRKQPRQSYLCLRDVARRSDFCNAIDDPSARLLGFPKKPLVRIVGLASVAATT